jgi:protein SCO1/2
MPELGFKPPDHHPLGAERNGAALASLIASLAVLALGLAVLGLTLYLTGVPGRPGTAQQTASIGGTFAAIDQSGRPVDQTVLTGQPTLLFFGFTHCPDVCPTKLYEIAQVMQRLGPAADRISVRLVSVDPERDTPELLTSYLASFDPRFRAITGTPEQIAHIARLWRAYYRKVPLEGGGYTVDHSAGVYLLDARGQFVSLLDVTDPDKAAATLRARL